MTLLISTTAAVVATLCWYNRRDELMKLGTLCLMYWGASFMWFVDAIFEYVELKEAFFTPAIEDMVNDTFLGLSVVVLGLVIWTVVLLVKDPKGSVRAALRRQKAE
ncbi:MAG: hypothetical protein IJ794_13425 [Lachnospiraceae bacterium]|nr:hypothetical protein [Lachnospiraceae bacterium]